MDGEKVVVAEIVRTRGTRGEVVARSQTDVPGRLEQLRAAHAQLADGSDVPVKIAAAWPHKGNWVLKFAGVDSVDAAERFRGADLWIPHAERASLPPGEFYRWDLVGCRVTDRSSGNVIGTVEGWQQYGEGTPLMQVGNSERQFLIPFASPLCDVDLAARTIRVDIPEGLLEL